MSNSIINNRKIEHIDIVTKDPEIERFDNGFDHIQLIHRALPEIDLSDIDTKCSFLGKTLSFPLIISSMTGGDDDRIRKINKNLAIAAETCQVALAVGSQRIMIREKAAKESFSLREYAPTTVLLSNLGAVQLNTGFGIKECRLAVETLNADGLYFHLNPLQEAIQPEGDTNFSGLTEKIAQIHRELSVPVLLKEVGCGLSPADIELGMKAGIRIFDIAGRGGTSWSRIEHHRRRSKDSLGLLFQDWGLTTAQSLLTAYQHYPDITLIASGGIRTGIDMAKAIALGAQLCGIAAPFLSAAQESAEAVIKLIQQRHKEYRTALFLMGCPNNDQLRGNKKYIFEATSL
ncbi:type 2 isopentenyl-diphosphate Delta-isomerase [Suttonella ornithocola]|uniref:Isopentenyl-diphosphate delta-isomerase n=1 Tax=Suttonella ornithocola TaxID=279832 RepID=A0A380MVI0_9GAMM|nr:type 2 isopentenyl-diphosphate Delta-isomerase [Suttonella ornithocola]SUO96565.1 Isopentenyl-diphosphate delta-isomerase [Suttonella ornithocola]